MTLAWGLCFGAVSGCVRHIQLCRHSCVWHRFCARHRTIVSDTGFCIGTGVCFDTEPAAFGCREGQKFKFSPRPNLSGEFSKIVKALPLRDRQGSVRRTDPFYQAPSFILGVLFGFLKTRCLIVGGGKSDNIATRLRGFWDRGDRHFLKFFI